MACLRGRQPFGQGSGAAGDLSIHVEDHDEIDEDSDLYGGRRKTVRRDRTYVACPRRMLHGRAGMSAAEGNQLNASALLFRLSRFVHAFAANRRPIVSATGVLAPLPRRCGSAAEEARCDVCCRSRSTGLRSWHNHAAWFVHNLWRSAESSRCGAWAAMGAHRRFFLSF